VTALRIETIAGAAIAEHTSALAALRIAVFREFPYLYAGTLAYEARYLASYAASDASTVVIARDGDRVVGASTAMPLALHSEEVVPPFVAAGYAPADVYYYGESVLDPAYRGRGIGAAFFAHREDRARALGYRIATFCAVERPLDHPRRPPAYAPPGALWIRCGFAKRHDLTTTFAWRDHDDAVETPKPMTFWIKELA
jgi:GNAT superfamily N-acetyltransferase